MKDNKAVNWERALLLFQALSKCSCSIYGIIPYIDMFLNILTYKHNKLLREQVSIYREKLLFSCFFMLPTTTHYNY